MVEGLSAKRGQLRASGPLNTSLVTNGDSSGVMVGNKGAKVTCRRLAVARSSAASSATGSDGASDRAAREMMSAAVGAAANRV